MGKSTSVTTDWKKLRHAYGNASNIPRLLEDLESNEPATRQLARKWLGDSLSHQGTLYAATAPALAELRARLGNRNLPDRAELFTLFAEVFTGESLDMRRDGYPPSAKALASKAQAHRRASLAEAEASVDELSAAVGDTDPRVRGAAAYAAAWLGTKADDLLPTLVDALALERDTQARASQLLALGYLLPFAKSRETAKRVRAQLEAQEVGGGAPADVPRVAAAIARAHAGLLRHEDFVLVSDLVIHGIPAPAEFDFMGRLALLHDALGLAPAGETRQPLSLEPWGDLEAFGFLHLDAWLESEAVVETWLRIAETDTRYAQNAAWEALPRVFPPGSTVDPTKLGAEQRRLVSALVKDGMLHPHSAAALARAGLPQDVAALRALVGLGPGRWQRPFTLAGETRPARAHLERRPVPVAAAAELPVEDALEVALLWATAHSGRPGQAESAAFDLLAETLTRRGARTFAGAVRAEAMRVVRRGIPVESAGPHSQWVNTGVPIALVEAGILLAARGELPERWFDAMIARLADLDFVEPQVARALALLPDERREIPLNHSLLTLKEQRFVAWGALAPEGTIMAVLERLAALNPAYSFFPSFPESLAAFGARAVPLLESVGLRPTTNHKAIFAATLRLLGAESAARAVEEAAGQAEAKPEGKKGRARKKKARD